MSRKLKDRLGCPGCFNCLPPVVPAAHPSFPRSLSPTPIGERESIPPLTLTWSLHFVCEFSESTRLDVGLPLDKPKVHGKTGVVAKTRRPGDGGSGRFNRLWGPGDGGAGRELSGPWPSPSADPGRRWRLPAPTAHRSGRGGGRCLACGYAGDGPQHTAYALDLAGDQLGHLRHVGCFD